MSKLHALAASAIVMAACETAAVSPDAAPDTADTGLTDAGRVDASGYPEVVVRPDERAPCDARDPLRRPLFGDLHVHTSLSFDSSAYDVRTRPSDAYAFARGEEIGLPPYDGDGQPTRTLRIDRPLDFAAVTDHSEFLGETAICTDPMSVGYESSTCTSWRSSRGVGGNYGELTATLILSPPRRVSLCRNDPTACAAALLGAWEEVQTAAELAYDRTSACSFTSFVAYEWTGTTLGDNLHRNIVFRNASVPRTPVSFVEAWTPERMWDAIEHGCLDTDTPCDVLAIPHNPNLSGGNMFVPTDRDGVEYDLAAATRRAALEPLVEMYQHKGASECLDMRGHPLASEDELCRFEEMHPSICRGLPTDLPECAELCDALSPPGFLGGCVAPSDTVRGALRTGIAVEQRVGANPFRFGIIGSTDTHNALAGGTEEATYRGHLGDSEDEPAELLMASPNLLLRGLAASPGGLAVVWAEENTRDAIFDAMRRREAYATSGTRIVVRMFAGPDLPLDLCSDPDMVRVGYERGVPMGSVTTGGRPRILVSAIRDPLGAQLERIQIVRGTVEADGSTTEEVFDVAGDPVTALPDASCAPPTGGADQLCAVWEDPDVDSTRPAFWYARVLEVSTCRWSERLCRDLGVDCATIASDDPLFGCCDTARQMIQERAWTSPIWLAP